MKVCVLLIVALAFIAAGLAQAGEFADASTTKTIVLPPDRSDLKAGSGLEKVQAYCLTCHSLDYIAMQPKFTRPQWTAALVKMIKVFGASIPDDDARIILDYLVENYGTAKWQLNKGEKEKE